MPADLQPEDIRLTTSLDHEDAKARLHDHAATLVALGHTQSHGVFIHPWGKGWAVFLRKYDTEDTGSAG